MGFLDKAKQAAQNAQKEGGLLDKAKDAAKQAQEKLDEKQKQFNQGQQAGSTPPPSAAPPAEAPAPAAPPPSGGLDAPQDEGEGDDYEPPKMTSGDPLAG